MRPHLRLLPALALLAAVPSTGQATRVLAFGDSITIGFREPGVECDRPLETARGYPEHLAQLLEASGTPAEVDPFGVCGESTFEGLTRIDEVLAAESAEAIVILEGINDLSSGNPVISIEGIEANLQLMADKARQAGVEPVIASTIPFGPEVDVMQRNQRAARLAENLRQSSAAKAVAYAEVFDSLFAIPDLFDLFYADGFHLNEAGNEVLAQVFLEPVLEALENRCVPGVCEPSPTRHCLGPDGRFAVEVEWVLEDGRRGAGQVRPFSQDTGQFWFFAPENIELVVKVLDGSCFNDRWWVFYGALSNVELSIRVTDSATCARRVYLNPTGVFASVGDSDAFAGDASGCP